MSFINRTGGCLCGNIRYSLTAEPLAIAVCHCRNCQKQSGSALSLIAVMPRNGVAVSGDLKIYEDHAKSGQPVYRQFCPDCGSPVITDTPQAAEINIIFIKAGTLDDPTGLKPVTHYWASRAHDWFPLPDDAEILQEQ